MTELTDIFTRWIQLDSATGGVMLLVVIVVLGIAAYRLNYRKHVDSNGKVVLTRRLNVSFKRFIPSGIRMPRKTKPFTPVQQRLLRWVYSIHEALFGLIVFAFGLGLVSKGFTEFTADTQSPLDPELVVLTLLGLLAMPIGVLLIYFRNAGNPFDDK